LLGRLIRRRPRCVLTVLGLARGLWRRSGGGARGAGSRGRSDAAGHWRKGRSVGWLLGGLALLLLDLTQPPDMLLMLIEGLGESVTAGSVSDEVELLGACRVRRRL